MIEIKVTVSGTLKAEEADVLAMKQAPWQTGIAILAEQGAKIDYKVEEVKNENQGVEHGSNRPGQNDSASSRGKHERRAKKTTR